MNARFSPVMHIQTLLTDVFLHIRIGKCKTNVENYTNKHAHREKNVRWKWEGFCWYNVLVIMIWKEFDLYIKLHWFYFWYLGLLLVVNEYYLLHPCIISIWMLEKIATTVTGTFEIEGNTLQELLNDPQLLKSVHLFYAKIATHLTRITFKPQVRNTSALTLHKSCS